MYWSPLFISYALVRVHNWVICFDIVRMPMQVGIFPFSTLPQADHVHQNSWLHYFACYKRQKLSGFLKNWRISPCVWLLSLHGQILKVSDFLCQQLRNIKQRMTYNIMHNLTSFDNNFCRNITSKEYCYLFSDNGTNFFLKVWIWSCSSSLTWSRHHAGFYGSDKTFPVSEME